MCVHCGAECPSDCRGSASGDTTSFSRQQRLSVRENPAECARMHAGVQSVHAATQTREMCAV